MEVQSIGLHSEIRRQTPRDQSTLGASNQRCELKYAISSGSINRSVNFSQTPETMEKSSELPLPLPLPSQVPTPTSSQHSREALIPTPNTRNGIPSFILVRRQEERLSKHRAIYVSTRPRECDVRFLDFVITWTVTLPSGEAK